MRKQKGRKNMSSTAAKVYDFCGSKSTKKGLANLTKTKQISNLSPIEMKKSMEFRKRSRERD